KAGHLGESSCQRLQARRLRLGVPDTPLHTQWHQEVRSFPRTFSRSQPRGTHRLSPSRNPVVGRWFTSQVELLKRRHQICGSAKLEREFCMWRFSSKLVRNGATALLLESNEVHKRVSNLIGVLKR